METIRHLAMQSEQLRILGNIAGLRANLGQKQAGTEELREAKAKMKLILGLLPEIGAEWAHEYMDFASTFDVYPRTVKVYVVGGLLRPKEPFSVRYNFEKKYYSDLDFVFGVDNDRRSLTSQAVTERRLEQLKRENKLEETSREVALKEAKALISTIRREQKSGEPTKEAEEEIVSKALARIVGSDPLIQRTIALASVKNEFFERLVDVVESKGIDDAEYCIDLLALDQPIFSTDDPRNRLVGAAYRETRAEPLS